MIIVIRLYTTKKVNCELLAYKYHSNLYCSLIVNEGYFSHKPEKLFFFGNMLIDTNLESNNQDAISRRDVFFHGFCSAKTLFETFDFLALDEPPWTCWP